jgi:hypothetical protein
VNETVNGPVVVVAPGTAFTLVGAEGTFATVNALDGAERVPAPYWLVAATVHVYVLPGVNPATAIGLDPVPDFVTPWLEDAHDAE